MTSVSATARTPGSAAALGRKEGTHGKKRFSLDTQSSIDVVLPSGQKIQYDHTVKVSVERPNRLRAERTGHLVDQVSIYDGASLTRHDPAGKHYATVAAKNWDLAPAFGAETFSFKPSPDLQKLEFLRVGGDGPKPR